VIRQTPAGVEIAVRVVPRAKETAIAGERNGQLLIRLSAPPADGAANEALVEFLSKRLGCPRRAIRLMSGEARRSKRLLVEGAAEPAVRAALLAGGVVR
jgi:uncharacterized protein (TIGR00251 family)